MSHEKEIASALIKAIKIFREEVERIKRPKFSFIFWRRQVKVNQSAETFIYSNENKTNKI